MRTLLPIVAAALLTGCGSAEPRSSAYFEAHPEEAKRIVAACKEGSTRGAECEAADVAVQTLEGKDRMRRFLGKD